ncbi:MAG: hypothetical protein ABUR63_00380 [Verrucomicrobiota bacterium]
MTSLEYGRLPIGTVAFRAGLAAMVAVGFMPVTVALVPFLAIDFAVAGARWARRAWRDR